MVNKPLNRIKCSLTSAEAIRRRSTETKQKRQLSVEAITTTTHTWDTSSPGQVEEMRKLEFITVFTVGLRLTPDLTNIIFIIILCRHIMKLQNPISWVHVSTSKQNRKLSEFLEAIGLWNYHLIIFFFALLFYHSSGNET